MAKQFVTRIYRSIGCLLVACLMLVPLAATEHKGQVKFGGLPLPGATITASQGDKRLTTVADQDGNYSFPDLADGVWKIEVEMLCFSTISKDVTIAAGAPAEQWELKLQSMDEIRAAAGPVEAKPAAPATETAVTTAPTPETNKTAAATPRGKNGKGKTPPPQPGNTASGFTRTDVNQSGPKPPEGAQAPPADSGVPADAAASQSANEKAADGFLINGTANNGASSPFAISQAFGNNRRGGRSLYNGNIGFILDNSMTDARSFSLTGQDTPKPAYNLLTGVAAFGGPLKIPHLLKNGPNIFATYQWTRNRKADVLPGLVPTLAERGGDFSNAVNPLGQPIQIFDPSTGHPFNNQQIPQSQISQQARALLNLYPLPNFSGSNRYNYQIPIVNITHQDALQTRANKSIGRKNQISGGFAFQSTRADNPNILGFLDTTDTTGYNANVSWRHSFSPRIFTTLTYQFSRQSVRISPFFENRVNVSGEAGITGNNQEPINWGPPNLNFSGGITSLTDAGQSFTRNLTHALSYAVLWNRGRHNFQFGADLRRQEFNLLKQNDARGTFTFTGASTRDTVNGTPVTGTGSDFAGFLLGIPDASSIAFGNADKYFRGWNNDAYFTDDWRMSPGFTLNIGVRWEYGSPLAELYNRLVNLDVAPGFSAVKQVLATDPTGPITGQKYPSSLIHPDKHGFQPRIGISWRPFAASSMIVRAGYGVYYNTSVYLPYTTQMSQQAPLSKSLSVQNSPDNPLTLANGFNASPTGLQNTFAIDPNLRVGYSQNWQASVQRDLPGALVASITYLGIKGTRGIQEFLPNTYPNGVQTPCPACPTGFAYLTSNGNSTRESGSVQVRRRLHNGFTSTVQYTFSKSIDDSALGGRGQGSSVVAQDWLNLAGERGLSVFDQRHLLTVQAQYTSGMGIGGGTLLSGWKGALLKEWTVTTQINAGSGLPLTPLIIAAVNGTGTTCCIRPDYTGAPLYNAPSGLFLNPQAYTVATGHWGNAGRDTITGPNQFTMGASLGRNFRLSDRFSMDLRVDATNAINHVTFPSWNTTVNSSQFGLPNPANPMRSMQTTLRVRF